MKTNHENTTNARIPKPKTFGELRFLDFGEGIKRIESALANLGMKSLSEDGGLVITSRDPAGARLKEALKLQGLPDGVEKWQLPVYFRGEGAQFFISVVEPRLAIGEHVHDNGAAIRFVASGCVVYGDQELTAGDWMFIPKNTPYSIRAGDTGAVLFYCYACCCAPI